ncbi:MAG: hypothetical protein D6725_04050 [Planctomycetota bacterium]|nr:MAG: hypothetical protein D6725_04050 [Planctomycetota bacterium]
MTMTAVQTTYVYVQARPDGNPLIWTVAGSRAPDERPIPASEFIFEVLQDKHGHTLRILPMHHACRFICDLYEALRQNASRVKIHLATPNLCPDVKTKYDPQLALQRMRRFRRPRSLGGWHVMKEEELPAYRLGAEVWDEGVVRKTHSRCNLYLGWRPQCGELAPEYYERVLPELLKQHPVYRDLAFIGTLDPLYAARVVGSILDPRWFVDPEHPDRTAALRNYMGLLPSAFLRVLAAETTGERLQNRYWRAYCALRSWYGKTDAEMGAEVWKPENFLYRRARRYADGKMGLVRATQAFLAYLTRAWLDRLVEGWELFDPRMLLPQEAAEAYRKYIDSLQQEG